MPQIIRNEVVKSAALPNVASSRYEKLLIEGGRYVFDGNRVTAHFRVDENGVGQWRLHTIDPNLSLVITPDLRIHMYRGTEGTCVVHIIRKFESTFDALKPLKEAICDCAQHGHAWSPAQDSACDPQYVWQWCALCGAEPGRFADTGEWLQWPDADEIAVRTAGALPRLHGPVVGGAR